MFKALFGFDCGFGDSVGQGMEAQEESKKDYLKLSPKEKARCKRVNEIIFSGDYICPHCKKDILEEK